ncbi:MAG: periplasmic heavy metal sensor [Caulobacteraceae bacterium]
MPAENAGERPAAFFWATSGMSQPAKRDTRRMLLALRDQVSPDVQRSRALRLQGWNGLTAAKPDAVAVKAALAQSRQIDVGVRTKVEEDIVDHVAQLPPPDRAAYAAGMSREINTPPKR